ncbi:hypothetical protein A3H87_02350 [Candidatus Curtissbacteria bacterium RIFCSPLOWO2_02_FULL_42_37]|nr:MAG: hypothetical protein A3H87_02350 [Candidatus Curtissbacteria bacterium RIFCSPLOWO2_02_FULL_42_37]
MVETGQTPNPLNEKAAELAKKLGIETRDLQPWQVSQSLSALAKIKLAQESGAPDDVISDPTKLHEWLRRRGQLPKIETVGQIIEYLDPELRLQRQQTEFARRETDLKQEIAHLKLQVDRLTVREQYLADLTTQLRNKLESAQRELAGLRINSGSDLKRADQGKGGATDLDNFFWGLSFTREKIASLPPAERARAVSRLKRVAAQIYHPDSGINPDSKILLFKQSIRS